MADAAPRETAPAVKEEDTVPVSHEEPTATVKEEALSHVNAAFTAQGPKHNRRAVKR